jgi:hypothetical protein
LTPMIVITHSPRDSSAKRSYGAITQDANYLTLMHFEKDVKGDETIIHVTGDSKLGTELDFNLKLVTEQVTQDSETYTEIRRVLHTDHVPNLSEAIVAHVKENPEATATEVSEKVGCTYEYARKIMKLCCKPTTPKPLKVM